MKSSAMIVLLLCYTYVVSSAQEQGLEIFKPLVGKTWSAEGQWGNGSKFRQEIAFRYELADHIVISESMGFTDPEQTKFGQRNFGVRKYDPDSGQIQFWEYDIFGGLTTGQVTARGKNIYYQYNYGGTELTDAWECIDPNTYGFTVGVMADGKWEKKYLETKFIAQTMSPGWHAMLSGKWIANAWDGELHEYWTHGAEGQMAAQVYYIEKGDTTYAAQTKIEQVGDELILISVIKDSNPKIFKATASSARHITFQNSDYANPSMVNYVFLDGDHFQRTISGTEKGKPSTYTFDFSKQ